MILSNLLRRGSLIASFCVLASLVATDGCKTLKSDSSQLRDVTGAAPAFDVNDLSILFPTDANGFPYPEIVISTATDAQGKLLWPAQTAFQAMLDFGQGKTQGTITSAPFFTGQSAGDTADSDSSSLALASSTASIEQVISLQPSNPVLTQANWRVMGLRADPCAEQDVNTCNVEFRLIVQPFNGNLAFDTAAHLLFNLGHLAVNGKSSEIDVRHPSLPASVTFQGLLQDLGAIKAAAAATKGSTDGQPLSIHPGLVAELAAQNNNGGTQGPVARLIDKLIKTYTQGGLTVVTTMQLNSPPLPWIFYQGTVTNGVWQPISITGGSPQMSVRFNGSGGFVPDPKNKSGVSNSRLLGGAPPATPQDFATSFKIDNPGKFNDANPRNSVNNTDCLSCHVGATAIQDNAAMLAVSQGVGVMYVPADGITGYMGAGNGSNQFTNGVPPQAVATGIWDFRNFGVSNNSRTSSIESRMLNEAAEAARFVNEDILQEKNPGFVCQPGASDAERQQNHAKLWDCNVKNKSTFASCAAQICPKATGLPSGAGGGTSTPTACTSQLGGVCGSQLGLDPNTLFQCVNGKPSFLAKCADGCQANQGIADNCKQLPPTPGVPPCTFGSGGVCGSVLRLDPNALFQCVNGSTQLLQRCQDGCKVNPGAPDNCIAGGTPTVISCAASTVPSCGKSFGQDPKSLFSCANGHLVKLETCANGCQANAVGVADQCVATDVACVSNTGAVCGGELGLDPNTLFQCIGGKASFVAHCPTGCQANQGRADNCNFPTPLAPPASPSPPLEP